MWPSIGLMATSSGWRDDQVLIMPSLLSYSSLRPPKSASSPLGATTRNDYLIVQGRAHRRLSRVYHLR